MRRIICALAAIICLVTAPAARADEPLPQPTSAGSNAIGACLEAKQVWLYVVDSDGTVVANQCVGTPKNGEAALIAAGAQVDHDKGGFICAIGGRPDPCPTTFDGTYWNYLLGAPGKTWERSSLGANARTPEPGTIEGWCRNKPDENECTLPDLKIVIDGEVQAPPNVDQADLVEADLVLHAPYSAASRLPVGTILAAGVIVALGVVAVIVVLRRRGQQPKSQGPEPLPER